MQDVLKKIENFFLSVTKNKNEILSCFENEALQSLNTEAQERIVEITIRNPLCRKYAPPLSYQKFFLRCLHDSVEKFGSECSDDLMKTYTDILTMQDDGRVSYHSYKIDGNCTITLQESSCIVVKNTTGLQTWEAGKYLSEWCIRNPLNFERKTVLELGSGIGLLGIVVLKFCNPLKYIFSDKSPEVLKFLSSNIKINIQDFNNSAIEQLQLFWSDVTEKEANLLLPDVILGADIVFDIDTIGSLVLALKILLVKDSACAYIASTIRNPETNNKFLAELATAGFIYIILKRHEQSIFIYDKSSDFVLYQILKLQK
ncbi:protein-lysine N-methyltransferase EEF2KMT [Nephila pilipes]|uniref:Protein-lysine N-methyltransferase EEF2KMT n=1 Tax=Nephila pilipes TaxID=299642 RepID=A0A8X6TPM9_NEPPI|nr:protein-lysine N-methyltransferase EEF2KMT [Nephila pilipes]